MLLFTKENMKKLLENGKRKSKSRNRPIVKLFTPDAQATWLISEIDPNDIDRAFGLCDLGLGSPELGYKHNRIKSFQGEAVLSGGKRPIFYCRQSFDRI